MAIVHKIVDIPNRPLPGIVIQQETGDLEKRLYQAKEDSVDFKGKVFKDNPMGFHYIGFVEDVSWAKFLADHPGINPNAKETIARYFYEYPQFKATKLMDFRKESIK